MIKDENYISIQGFMVTRLGLKGNELLVYAIIFGFSQDGACKYTGGIKYLIDWTNASKQTVITAIKNLVDKDLIIPEEVNSCGVRFVNYSINMDAVTNLTSGQKIRPGGQKIRPGVVKNFDRGGQKIRPNNINNNISNNINNNIDILSKCGKTAQEIVDDYHAICKSLPKVQKLSDARKKKIKAFTKEFSAEDIETIFCNAEKSDFLTGRSGKWSGCGFDWLINLNNAVKVLEGNYSNKGEAEPSKPTGHSKTYMRLMGNVEEEYGDQM